MMMTMTAMTAPLGRLGFARGLVLGSRRPPAPAARSTPGVAQPARNHGHDKLKASDTRDVDGSGSQKKSKPKAERVDRLLSRLGYCTRSEAKRWVSAGRVTVGAMAVTRADAKVSIGGGPDDAVKVDGEPLEHPHGLVAVMNKPAGRVCSHDPREGPSVYDLLPDRWRRRSPGVEAVGRLDKDTTGLLLFTDDGNLLHRLTSPRKDVPKVYRLETDVDIPMKAAAVFAAGELTLNGENKPCLPATLRTSEKSARTATLELREGKFHQVKRMMLSQGCAVTRLHRESFGGLTLSGLAEAEVRVLDPRELECLGLDAR